MSDKLQTLTDYYEIARSKQHYAFATNEYQSGKSHFNINIRKYCSFPTPYNRRDFYKICLIIGTGEIRYGQHKIFIDKPALFLPCPTTPYEWICQSSEQDGFFCLFNQEFFNEHNSIDVFKKTALFKEWSKPLIFLNDEQLLLINTYFKQIYEMFNTDYPLKFEIIRNLLALILHQALQLSVTEVKIVEPNSASRLFKQFDELLNTQFPLDSPAYPLLMTAPVHFASKLNVHVNHLNSSIKAATGRTTTQIIKERILGEAKSLLTHTDWNISEIGYTLGFEQPSHFNNFFKKHTDSTPLQFRVEQNK